jgi:hypothetical protein
LDEIFPKTEKILWTPANGLKPLSDTLTGPKVVITTFESLRSEFSYIMK